MAGHLLELDNISKYYGNIIALQQKNLKRMLAIRESEEFTVHTLCVYHTKEPQRPRLLFRVGLQGGEE